MPVVRTVCPTYGDEIPGPWMSWMASCCTGATTWTTSVPPPDRPRSSTTTSGMFAAAIGIGGDHHLAGEGAVTGDGVGREPVVEQREARRGADRRGIGGDVEGRARRIGARGDLRGDHQRLSRFDRARCARGGGDGRRPGRGVRFDDEVVDAHPFVAGRRVGGQDAKLHDRLVVHRRRQGHVHRRHLRGEVRSGRRIGDVGGSDVGPRARCADAIVERDLLHGVVRRAIDVADVVAHADAGDPGRVDGEPQVRRIGGAGPLEGDDRVGELELGDATSGEPGAGLVGVDVGNAGVVSAASTVRASVLVAVTSPSPRKPSMPGTPLHVSSAVISPVLVQSCANGSACGAASARRRAASAVISSAPRAARGRT